MGVTESISDVMADSETRFRKFHSIEKFPKLPLQIDKSAFFSEIVTNLFWLCVLLWQRK